MKYREIWVDYVKVIAFTLVALGHFYQSMVKSNIIPVNDLYIWFNHTIYLFHVPLFFICSGYLYKKYSKFDNFSGWVKNIKKKAFILGIPYVVFSSITYILKKIFSNDVNAGVQHGYLETLLLFPIAPYWYLYALFFMYVITHYKYIVKCKENELLILCIIAVFFRLAYNMDLVPDIELLNYISSEYVYFIIGIMMAGFDVEKIIDTFHILIMKLNYIWMIFVALSFYIFYYDLNKMIDFIIGMVACICIVFGVMLRTKSLGKNNVLDFLSQYIMPVFLLHTLCAASMRILLIKIGIVSIVPHVLIGLLFTFCGPIFIANILRGKLLLEVFIYPEKIWKRM